MSRRTRLTLFSVLMIVLLACAISVVYIGNQIDRQFSAIEARAEPMSRLAADAVARTLDRAPSLPVPDALIDRDLVAQLRQIMTVSGSILEIAVCDPKSLVLLSTDSSRVLGEPFPVYPDYGELVKSDLREKVRVLRSEKPFDYYELVQWLEAGGQRVASVRVVIYPALMRAAVIEDLKRAGFLSLLSIAMAAFGTLLFSSYAFRPLSQVSQMLDLLARGESLPGDTNSQDPPKQDEFGAVLSKVSLLGQRLGNIDRLLDQLEEAVLVFGQDDQLVVASGATEKFVGRPRVRLLGIKRQEVFPPNSPVGLLLEEIVQANRAVRDLRIQLQPDPGPDAKPLPALLSVDLLGSGEGILKSGGILVRLRDPEARRQIQGQLQTAQRLSAINRVTGGVAHEVKNPLNAMLMHVELARMKLARGDTDIGQQMEIITREILRLDRVVKTFLDFTRPLELKLAEHVLDDLIGGVVDLARPQAVAAGVRIQAELGTPGVRINADNDMLRQAVLNLIVNAIEAMPEGGDLAISTRKGEHGENGLEAEVTISDTGCGIPAERREKIFQLYYTTKQAGSGIGLAMTFRIVQLHDGRIEFTSESGKGTSFMLRFPVASGGR